MLSFYLCVFYQDQKLFFCSSHHWQIKVCPGPGQAVCVMECNAVRNFFCLSPLTGVFQIAGTKTADLCIAKIQGPRQISFIRS